MMRLLVARHGKAEKKVNERGFPQILGGSFDFDRDLAPEGVKEAEKLGEALRNYKIDRFYSSALKRASQTAEAAIRSYKCDQYMDNPAYPILFDSYLHERHFGILSGKFCDEILFRDDVLPYLDQKLLPRLIGVQNNHPNFGDYLRHVLYESGRPNVEATTIVLNNSKLPGLDVEKMDDVISRIALFEEHLKETHNPDATIAVFTHGDVLRCWMHKVALEPDMYSQKTVDLVRSIPNMGIYRRTSHCSLFDFVLR